jgi:hypothetical protein
MRRWKAALPTIRPSFSLHGMGHARATKVKYLWLLLPINDYIDIKRSFYCFIERFLDLKHWKFPERGTSSNPDAETGNDHAPIPSPAER